MFRLADPFPLFATRFMGAEKPIADWAAHAGAPDHRAWADDAFALVCLNHLNQIRRALSLDAILITQFPWQSREAVPGAHVDLVIERPDGITYLCDMRFASDALSVSKDYRAELLRKAEVFKAEAGTKDTVQTVVIASSDFRRDNNANSIVRTLGGDDLFRP